MGNAGRVLMIPKGDYNAATTYEMLDCVYYNGRSYVCKQTSTGNAPTNTTYWQVMTPDASAEIQALTNYVTENNVKNLLPNNLVSQTITSNDANLTVVVNNGIVTLNGTTGTNSIILRICDIVYNSQIQLATLFGKRVKMSGCPSGGSRSTYYLNFYKNKSSESNDEYGNGATFDVENDGEAWVSVSIVLAAGQTLNNLVFKPMITLSDIPDSDYAHYQPYAKTNVELTQGVAGLFNLVTQGGNNLIDGTTAFTTLENLKVYTMTTGNPWESDGYNASVFVLKSFSNMGYQVAFKLLSASGAAEMAIRQCYNGMYGTWQKVTST